MTSCNWLFTVNNYTEEVVEAVRALIDSPHCTYVVFGYEVGALCGTPHLQCFAVFNNKPRHTAIHNTVPTASTFIAHGTATQNIDYCKKGTQPKEEWDELGRDGPNYGKDAKFEEFGDPPLKVGKRKEMEVFKDAVKSGQRDLKILREDYSNVCARYPNFVQLYINDNTKIPFVQHPLRQWQTDFETKLYEEPSDRLVYAIVGAGNDGKTWFAKYIYNKFPNVQIFQVSKAADMAFALSASVRYLFINVPYDSTDLIDYGFLEQVKDGIVFSGKFCSASKILEAIPHVVLLMNREPSVERMAQLRFEIINI